MSTKVTIDGNGHEMVVLEYHLKAADLVDFTLSRYIAVGNFRRNVLITRIVGPCVMILVAAPLAYWLDLRGWWLAGSAALLAILALMETFRAPKKHLQRFSKKLQKLFSKDPALSVRRRLTITPDAIEQELENHCESSAWKGVREI